MGLESLKRSESGGKKTLSSPFATYPLFKSPNLFHFKLKSQFVLLGFLPYLLSTRVDHSLRLADAQLCVEPGVSGALKPEGQVAPGGGPRHRDAAVEDGAVRRVGHRKLFLGTKKKIHRKIRTVPHKKIKLLKRFYLPGKLQRNSPWSIPSVVV